MTRHEIARIFGINKRGATEVFNNEVIKDGYPIGDVETALNLGAIQKYVGSNEKDFGVLWEKFIEKIEGRTPAEITPPPPIIPTSPDPIVVEKDNPVTHTTKRRGRPSTKNS